MSTHPDLPDTLVHFTGRPRRQSDLPPDFAHGGAEDRLVSILHSGTLRGAPDYWSDAPVISFSEVTEDARRAMLRDGAAGGARTPPGVSCSIASSSSAPGPDPPSTSPARNGTG